MIRLLEKDLPKAAVDQLEAWQIEVDALASYPERVNQAGELFKSRNRKSNPTFRAVRNTLAEMCSGNQRCCYCEDSAGYQVEHILPKSLFPGQTFAWDNYLLACGDCNSPKSNRYAYFQDETNSVKEFVRKKNEVPSPPPAGNEVLINPRKENPLAFIKLDMEDSFLFLESAEKGTREWERANYTIKILGLNRRTYLPRGRKMAFENYCLRLEKYIAKRDAGVSKDVLGNLILGIQNHPYPTVWKEMQRFHDKHPDLKPLFEAAPEALSW